MHIADIIERHFTEKNGEYWFRNDESIRAENLRRNFARKIKILRKPTDNSDFFHELIRDIA